MISPLLPTDQLGPSLLSAADEAELVRLKNKPPGQLLGKLVKWPVGSHERKLVEIALNQIGPQVREATILSKSTGVFEVSTRYFVNLEHLTIHSQKKDLLLLTLYPLVSRSLQSLEVICYIYEDENAAIEFTRFLNLTCPSLEKLTLDQDGVDEAIPLRAQSSWDAKKFPPIKRLVLEGFVLDTANIFHCIGSIPTLKELVLNGSYIQDSSLYASLQHLSQLDKILYIADEFTNDPQVVRELQGIANHLPQVQLLVEGLGAERVVAQLKAEYPNNSIRLLDSQATSKKARVESS